jgi:Antirestriction protein
MAHAANCHAPGDLIAEDEGYERIARGILDAVERGPEGQWRMPWHAITGGLPENAFSVRRFKATNLLTLAAATKKKRFAANLWAPRAQWEKRRGSIRSGEQGTVILVPVFDELGPTTRWDAGSRDMQKRLGTFGGDPEGGEQRRMLGFRPEPWFNIAQVAGADIRPPAPTTPSEAAVRLDGVLAAWRTRSTGRRGPALLYGGHQAYWNPATDQIMSPPPAAYGDHDGLSGLEYYVTTLAHESIHASGSRNRLNRSSLAQYNNKVGRAKEEMVAEMGAAFLCGRFGLGTVLRPDHAIYVESWLGAIADRNQRKAFFWAVREAEKAADYILAQAGHVDGGPTSGRAP